MRKIIYIAMCTLAFSVTAQAQTTPEKKAAPKSDKSATSKSAPKADKPMDLDAFFKQGEKNAKEGASCSKPTKPSEPVA